LKTPQSEVLIKADLTKIMGAKLENVEPERLSKAEKTSSQSESGFDEKKSDDSLKEQSSTELRKEATDDRRSVRLERLNEPAKMQFEF
jgi:hypothetical protein